MLFNDFSFYCNFSVMTNNQSTLWFVYYKLARFEFFMSRVN